MNIKPSEVKSPVSFKSFLSELAKAKRRTYTDMIVEVLDNTIFVTPESSENDCDANNYGNYRKYSFEISTRLNVQGIEEVCKELGVRFDNYDLV